MHDKERYSKYAEIIARAKVMRCIEKQDSLSAMLDIESADKKFNLLLDDWLDSDDLNFSHDFIGIRNNVVRCDFPSTDFGMFVPRFVSSS